MGTLRAKRTSAPPDMGPPASESGPDFTRSDIVRSVVSPVPERQSPSVFDNTKYDDRQNKPSRFQGLMNALGLGTRLTGSVASAEGGLPGAAIGAGSEGLAQLLEAGGKLGQVWGAAKDIYHNYTDPYKESSWKGDAPSVNDSMWEGFKEGAKAPLARMGVEGLVSAIPANSVVQGGRRGVSTLRSGALAGGGEAGREVAQGEAINPKAIALSALLGGQMGNTFSGLVAPAVKGSNWPKHISPPEMNITKYPTREAYEASKAARIREANPAVGSATSDEKELERLFRVGAKSADTRFAGRVAQGKAQLVNVPHRASMQAQLDALPERTPEPAVPSTPSNPDAWYEQLPGPRIPQPEWSVPRDATDVSAPNRAGSFTVDDPLPRSGMGHLADEVISDPIGNPNSEQDALDDLLHFLQLDETYAQGAQKGWASKAERDVTGKLHGNAKSVAEHGDKFPPLSDTAASGNWVNDALEDVRWRESFDGTEPTPDFPRWKGTQDPRVKLASPFTASEGFAQPEVMAGVAGGAAGGLYGVASADDDENPLLHGLAGAVGGAALGAGGTHVLSHPDGPMAGVKKLGRTVPNIERFNFLANLFKKTGDGWRPGGLPANALLAPWSSVLLGGTEAGLAKTFGSKAAANSGNGWGLAADALNPMNFAKAFGESSDEAARRIAMGEAGRTDVTTAGYNIPGMNVPAKLMTQGDAAGQHMMGKRGFDDPAQRNMTMTNTPENQSAKNTANWVKNSTINSTLMPFSRTPINVAEQGVKRFPILGMIANRWGAKPDDWQTIAAQQAMSIPMAFGAYELGEHVDPETARWLRRYVTNGSARFGLGNGLAFAAGQAVAKGNDPLDSFANDMTFDSIMPLPSFEVAKDAYNAVRPNTGKSFGERLPRGTMPDELRELLFPKPKRRSLRSRRQQR